MKKRAVISLAMSLAVLGPALAAHAMISPDYIRRVIRAHLPEIRQCYEDRLQARPDLAGRVTMRFTVEPDGHVSGATVVSSTMHDAGVESCLVERVSAFRFATRDGVGSISVNYPFVFEAASPSN